MERTFEPASKLGGVLKVPGDKSVSHRAAVLAAMARGTSQITNVAPGNDVAATVRCLGLLGVEARLEEGALIVQGEGWSVGERAELDAENSGTTMRLLAGALAGRRGEFLITGDDSLSKRPMDRVAVPLRKMGATVELRADRFPPMRVLGGELSGITYETPVASAQVKAAILLAGLQARGPTTVIEKHPTRDHTERMLQWLGAAVSRAPGEVSLQGGGLPFSPFELSVPGDFSSAAYWIVAGLLTNNGDVLLEDVGLNPSRMGLLDVLNEMDANIETDVVTEAPEPAGTIRAWSGPLVAATVRASLTARTIDELSLVALAATQSEGTTIVGDAAELRVKESDRVAVLVEGLRTLGAYIEEAPDGFSVTGPTRLTGGRVDPKGDHRMALTFAVAGLVAQDPVTVIGWECTRISYPGFKDDLLGLLA